MNTSRFRPRSRIVPIEPAMMRSARGRKRVLGSKMKFFDVQSPFFTPIWRRIVATGLCLGWATVELLTGNMFWGMLFGAAGVFLAHQFFVVFDPRPAKEKEKS